ncbi:hypothetical protein [Nostoc sp. 'Lobaria pulmonaria (5183) cyanobiont']|nr:hypothetical protein [Nostoc sp. 'Lobaria pulmonaria (5183) cyanobiont']
MKASLELAFRLSRSQSPTGNAHRSGGRAARSRISSLCLETRFEKGF